MHVQIQPHRAELAEKLVGQFLEIHMKLSGFVFVYLF